MRSPLLLALLFSAPAAFAADEVQFFYGKVVYDYGSHRAATEALSLVKRVVSDGASQIAENVVEKESGEPAQEFNTLLVRQGDSSKFDVRMEGLNMEGTMTFPGPGVNNWTYDLSIYPRDQEAWQKISGSGSIGQDGVLHSEKTIEFWQGEKVILLIGRKEELSPVSEVEFAKRRIELLGK